MLRIYIFLGYTYFRSRRRENCVRRTTPSSTRSSRSSTCCVTSSTTPSQTEEGQHRCLTEPPPHLRAHTHHHAYIQLSPSPTSARWVHRRSRPTRWDRRRRHGPRHDLRWRDRVDSSRFRPRLGLYRRTADLRTVCFEQSLRLP